MAYRYSIKIAPFTLHNFIRLIVVATRNNNAWESDLSRSDSKDVKKPPEQHNREEIRGPVHTMGQIRTSDSSSLIKFKTPRIASNVLFQTFVQYSELYICKAIHYTF